MANSNVTELTQMLGRRVDFTHVIPVDEGPDFANVVGSVLAVVVPAPGTSIGASLLVLQDGFTEPEYFDLDEIRISSLGS